MLRISDMARTFCAALVFFALTLSAPADVFNMGSDLTSLQTVPVGNVGNTADSAYGGSAGAGAVDYAYNIGTYEVTAGQYCEFLNAVAATDTYGLYSIDMWQAPFGCRIEQTDEGGGFTYSVAADQADRPVNYVSWGDAARFANWLHNGQPTGMQDLTTTEDGAYYLNGAISDADLQAVSREADWAWAIPTRDEWHKAAYHDNHDANPVDDYFVYPTSSDNVPGFIGDGEAIPDPDPGNYATYDGDAGDDGIGSPYYRTEVGEHESSPSPYGTFDQGGNLWEWTAEIHISMNSYRALRGGSYYYGSTALKSRDSVVNSPSGEYHWAGFRLSQAADPDPLGGDADLDGDVDLDDFVILKKNFNTGSTWGEGDFDEDGDVDLDDFVILKKNFATATPSTG